MKGVPLTLATGARVHLNPLHMTMWGPAIVEVPGFGKVKGAMVFLGAAPQNVQESTEQIDWLFEHATADYSPKRGPPPASAPRAPELPLDPA